MARQNQFVLIRFLHGPINFRPTWPQSAHLSIVCHSAQGFDAAQRLACERLKRPARQGIRPIESRVMQDEAVGEMMIPIKLKIRGAIQASCPEAVELAALFSWLAGAERIC